jgi:hypothetical protein
VEFVAITDNLLSDGNKRSPSACWAELIDMRRAGFAQGQAALPLLENRRHFMVQS